ncbi:MAG: DUF1851 domain-containing protein [Chlorobiaceae bacterium]|nr:DUF1851 domain-containing protein [Chlorobiaceae bacterium]
MYSIFEFLEKHPRNRGITPLDTEASSRLLKCNAPEAVASFLHHEGVSAYHDDFFFTTMPDDHFETLSAWGLNGTHCFAFLRTAFGSIIYSYNGLIFQLDPISGYVYSGQFDLFDFLNLLATMDSFLESTYFDIYQQVKKNETLGFDEVYALTPPLPLGGSFESSHFEIVKMREYLAVTARLYGNKAREL